ncbi:MAG TPA: DUF4135 domain-containing protein, partial [Chlamydiales bacterium]|nr:DUF4135 domain-containing protein [Chlamydiales bacterium]
EIESLDLIGDDLDRQSAEYAIHKNKIKEKEKELYEATKSIKNLEKDLLIDVNNFLGHPESISHLTVKFSAIISLRFDDFDKEIEFRRVRLINHLRNVSMFLSNTIKVLSLNKALIVKEFCENIELDPSDLTFYLKPLGEETHNRGQSAVEVSLFDRNEKLLRKIIYKPRNAETEVAILELFKNLNLKKEESVANLPLFKIINLGNEGSFWEFITRADGGGHLQDDAIVELEAMRDTEFYNQAKSNFVRLESVCQAIGITDLHPENIILRNHTEWVPIDMEVIKYGHVTGLYGKNTDPEPLPFSTEEQCLITQFKNEQIDRLFRVVPITTYVLGNMSTTPWGGVKIASLLYESLGKEYNISIEPIELEKLATVDLVNADIPVLYQKSGMLYYSSGGVTIGKIKEGGVKI